MEALGGMMIGLWIFLIILAIAWVIMPFAIIGTKPILRELLAQMKENNKLSRDLQARLQAQTKALIAEGLDAKKP